MSGTNIGNLLNTAGVSWGWFEGGFDLTKTNPNGTTGCSRSTTSLITGTKKADYIPHHQPFQYYSSTENPTHVRPTSTALIGQAGDAANHQYDLNDFFAAIQAGNFPAISFLKAPGFQDGHAGYSDPIDEQEFMVNTINYLQTLPSWQQTAVVISYDDSDGWYDHQLGPLVNQSASAADAIAGTGSCGNGATALPGVASGTANAQGRCGYGPRLPLLVISPWAKNNFVDHGHRPDFRPAFHRRRLAERPAHRRRILRCAGELAGRHAELLDDAECGDVCPRCRQRPGGEPKRHSVHKPVCRHTADEARRKTVVFSRIAWACARRAPQHLSANRA